MVTPIAPARTPLRICLVAPPWLPVPPPFYGGTENVIDDLAHGLAVAGHEVVLHTTGDSTCPVPRRWTYEVAQSSRLGEAVVEVRHVLDAHDHLAEFDVVHDHTIVGPLLAGATTDRVTPVVTTCHGPFDGDLRPIYRRIARHVPVIAISHHQASTAGDIPIAAVIHHGVDPARFPVGRGDGGYVVFLGRMAPGKGVEVAARVARAAGVPLKIAAKMREPGEHEYFERRVRRLLGPEVEFLGEVGGVDKSALLGGARALLNPIRWDEPFGMVMIESMACGTPIVATPRGSMPEIVEAGVTGVVVEGEPALVEALGRLDELDRAACRTAVETRFSARRMVDDHVALYRRLAGPMVVDLDQVALAGTDVRG
jgi:glycosyltransferase involved in cell wall biosynthesis